MPRPQKRGRRADADKEFRVDPTEEDEEEEPVADDDEDEEARRKKQREVDAKNGFALWGDVQRDKTTSPKGPLAFLQGNTHAGRLAAGPQAASRTRQGVRRDWPPPAELLTVAQIC